MTPPPVWTSDAPTVPGFYFMRRSPYRSPRGDIPDIDVGVVYYQGADIGQPDIDGGLYVSGAHYHGGKMSDPWVSHVEWSGPLHPPSSSEPTP